MFAVKRSKAAGFVDCRTKHFEPRLRAMSLNRLRTESDSARADKRKRHAEGEDVGWKLLLGGASWIEDRLQFRLQPIFQASCLPRSVCRLVLKRAPTCDVFPACALGVAWVRDALGAYELHASQKRY